MNNFHKLFSLLAASLFVYCACGPLRNMPDEQVDGSPLDLPSLHTAHDSLLPIAVTKHSSESAGKFALIVAISRYRQFGDLHAHNDVPLLKAALQHHGFAAENIHILVNEQATRAGINTAWEKHLTQRADAGDIAVFCFSGHGTRIADKNGDEMDGLDEALVPFDADTLLGAATLLRDDDLNGLVYRLRRHLGPEGNLFMSIDACFSGSITRDVALIPGRSVAFAADFEAAARMAGSGSLFFETPTALKHRGKMPQTTPADNLAPFVVLSAAAHNQIAVEAYRDNFDRSKPVGRLSLALYEALLDAQPSMSYRALFERVRMKFRRKLWAGQDPQLEGDADVLLFSGAAQQREARYPIVRMPTGTSALIGGGRWHGILPGAEIVFAPQAATAPPDLAGLAKGIVLSSAWNHALVKLENHLPFAMATTASAFVSRYALGSLRLRIRIESRTNNANTEHISERLRSMPFVEIDAMLPDIVIAVGPDSVVIELMPRRHRAGVYRAGAGVEDSLCSRLVKLARNRYLLGMTSRDDSISVVPRLIPALPQKSYTCVPDSMGHLYQIAAQSWRLSAKQCFMLSVRNTGRADAFISALSIMPQGDLAQLFPLRGPDGNLPGQDYLLPAGKEYTFSYVFAGESIKARFNLIPAPGIEHIMIIATPQQINFDALLEMDCDRVIKSAMAFDRGGCIEFIELQVQP